MKNKHLFLFLIFIFMLAACSGGGWTKASGDAGKCDDGKKIDEWLSDLTIAPAEGDSAVIWQSYNGSGCGEEVGELASGIEIEWAQIVENTSGDMLVNVRSSDLSTSGWVNCADLSFSGNMESIMDKIPDEGGDLYVACVNISKQ